MPDEGFMHKQLLFMNRYPLSGRSCHGDEIVCMAASLASKHIGSRRQLQVA